MAEFADPQWATESAVGGDDLSARAYERALDRCERRVLGTILRLDLETRQVRIAEQEGSADSGHDRSVSRHHGRERSGGFVQEGIRGAAAITCAVSRLVCSAVAATIEWRDGLRCGDCGGRHVASAVELNGADDACRCQCCRGICDELFVAWLEREHPDLLTIRRGVRVVTRTAFVEARRRAVAELASLEALIGQYN